MKILVVGLGYVARRHIKNLKQILSSATLAVWRHERREDDLEEIAPWIDHLFFSEKEALDWKPEVALITTPAAFHLKAAQPLALQGVHLFIEKPISHSEQGLEELLVVCRKNKTLLFVGYNFRFYPPFHLLQTLLKEKKIGRLLSLRAEVGQFLPDWRPSKNYQSTASAQKDLGGGVLLELSHELDFLRWLGGEIHSVFASTKQVSDLEIDVEDTADLILRFSSGAIGSVHLDMVDHVKNRNLRIVGTEGTLTWDGITHEVKWYSTKTKEWVSYPSPSKWEPNQMYIDEMKNFLNSISFQTPPAVDAGEAVKTLQVILAAQRSAKMGKVVTLPS